MILVLIPSNGGREVNGAQNYLLLWWGGGVDDWSSPYFLTGNLQILKIRHKLFA